ncbi:MAG: hypothetical protein RLZZ490_1351 [Cyanobacteriota bacterium]|jgi:hypothetical protein
MRLQAGLSIVLLVGLIGTGCLGTKQIDSGYDGAGSAIHAQSGQGLDSQVYAEVLITYVDDQGRVNYPQLQQNRQGLDRYLQAIANVPQASYEQFSAPEKIAFWINAYNAITLKSIIDQTPLKTSIRDIPGVWKWRKHPVAGQSLTLDNIEHDILRQQFNEPRIHGALVCAAKSCPPLRQEPYDGDRLDAQLQDQTNRFLHHPQGFHLDQANKTVYLSSIFQWFGQDWQKSFQPQQGFQGNDKEKAVLNFISNYLPPSQQTFLQNGEYQIQYFDYDWSLNQQP